MPTYVYKCKSCDNSYETREGFDAPSRQPCPRCGAEAKRVLFPPPIVFKGGGFYITDSRKGTSATFTSDTGPGGANSESSKSESSSSSGGDSKPATAAASDD